MKGKTRPRRLKGWNKCFFVSLAFYLFHTWSFNRYAGTSFDENIIQDSSTTSDTFFLSTESNRPGKDVCDSVNASFTNSGIIGESVFRHWKFIDDTTKQEFPDAGVSGGIFLYPRQASILTHLISRMHAWGRKKTITICETGYGSGHSMALFQEASTSVRVVSFDKFDRPYQLPIWHRLNETISATNSRSSRKLQDKNNYSQKSFDFVKGDSCKTVPNHLSSLQCDVLHGSSLCPTDNIDLVENSPCGVLLTSTAMNSLNDRQVYFGRNAQWRKLRERNCITNIVCFKEDGVVDLKRDFIFAKQGSIQTGMFCVALTTGRCQRGKTNSEMSQKCVTDINQLLRHLRLNEICLTYRIEAPV